MLVFTEGDQLLVYSITLVLFIEVLVNINADKQVSVNPLNSLHLH
jgi:hypothetical protein